MSLAKNVVILDTGCCNLTSLKAAVERLGVDPIVSRDAAVIRSAQRLFLPGVGTAKAAMTMLKARDLESLIVEARQPVLGICLGMQLLGRTSEETGGVPMLGLIDRPVRQLQTGDLPLPHMGWNQINPTDDPLFKGIATGTHFYFVHSFAMPVNDFTIARAEYGEAFSAAVRRDNFRGVQFHPERSGAAGAKLLENFLECGL